MMTSYSLNSVLENYAKWHLILPILELLDSSFRSAVYAFTRVVSGDGEKDRYKFCIPLVQEVTPLALALPYTNALIPNATKICNVTAIAPLLQWVGRRGEDVMGVEYQWSAMIQ